MPPQTHVVLREIAEVAIPDARHAREVHETFGRVLRDVVPALIQGRCDEWSSPDAIHRLETVEINLGRVPLAQLETALTRTLEAMLPASLETAIRQSEGAAGGQQTTRSISHLELVEQFLRTGALPWWADRAKTDILSESLRTLRREASPALVAALRRWAQNPTALRRLVRAITDDDLRGLLRVLQPDAAEVLGGLPDALRALAEEGVLRINPRGGPVRHEAWEVVLTLVAGSVTPTARDDLLAAAVRRLGAALDAPAQTLLDALSAQPEWKRLLPAGQPGPRPSPRLTGQSNSLLAEWYAAVEPWLDRCPAGLRADLDALLARSGPDAPPGADLRRWLLAALETGALPRGPFQVWLSRFGPEHPTPVPTLPSVGLASPGADFHDADALYIDNAGLVILWPFLTRFFENLGLVAEKRFVDEWARHHAAALLQFLLTWERLPPLEYLLPLNKVLCGLAPDVLFEPGAPVTDDEEAECERFLTAVIEQAPILRRMSLPGFRGTFLARRGQLGTRDGSWLLRVERATYDVVLDQFPWSFQWVRLPWMAAPMCVEW